MNLSQAGRELIQHWEGYREEAYPCSANVWTIGWGHTKGVQAGDTCTREEAERWFEEDTEWAVDDTAAYLLDAGPRRLEQHEFDALVSWVFNVGTPQMKESTLRRRIVDGVYEDVPNQLRRWNKAGGKVVQGLVNRREDEVRMWLDQATESGYAGRSQDDPEPTIPAPEGSLEERVVALEKRLALAERRLDDLEED